MAACYALLGKEKETRAAAAEFRERAKTEVTNQADWTDEVWHSYWSSLFNFKNPEVVEDLLDGLHKANLP